MKTILTLIMLALYASAQARIGETPAECVKRYGNPSGMDGKKTTFYFTKDAIKIAVTFENGKCVKITYTPTESRWTKEDEVRLRLINDSSHEWHSQSDILDTCWHSTGGLFFLRPGFSQMITVQTDESYYRDVAEKEAKQKAEQQATRAAEIKKLDGL